MREIKYESATAETILKKTFAPSAIYLYQLIHFYVIRAAN